MSKEISKSIKHYFVDETGDLTLFNKKGQILVGRDGVSKTFMVGVADIPTSIDLTTRLNDLRESILLDPYYKGVPSLQNNRRKTALLFHAKNDLPEVRREVFKVLHDSGIKVLVAIRRKNDLIKFASSYFKMTGKKLTENEIYDDLIKRLFRNLLHKADENIIVFSKRGISNRTNALASAIEKAKRNFEIVYNKKSNKKVIIHSAFAHEYAGLQAIDYYLWALQRVFEKNEVRFYEYLLQDFRLVMDLDDTRTKKYGEWYSHSNTLDFKKIKPV